VVDTTYWSALSNTPTSDPVASSSSLSSHQVILGNANSITVHLPADCEVVHSRQSAGGTGVGGGPSPAVQKPQSSVLFHTHFTNNTPDIQVSSAFFHLLFDYLIYLLNQ